MAEDADNDRTADAQPSETSSTTASVKQTLASEHAGDSIAGVAAGAPAGAGASPAGAQGDTIGDGDGNENEDGSRFTYTRSSSGGDRSRGSLWDGHWGCEPCLTSGGDDGGEIEGIAPGGMDAWREFSSAAERAGSKKL